MRSLTEAQVIAMLATASRNKTWKFESQVELVGGAVRGSLAGFLGLGRPEDQNDKDTDMTTNKIDYRTAWLSSGPAQASVVLQQTRSNSFSARARAARWLQGQVVPVKERNKPSFLRS
jgi:hypothetical protein